MRKVAAYLSCCLLWGSTWMAIKIGLRDLPPLFFAGTRMMLAAAVLFPFALRAGLTLTQPLAVIGVLQIGIPYALMFAAQQWLPSALAAVLFATFPVWLVPRVPISAIGAIPLLDTTVAVILGALVLRERIGWPLLAGGALVLTGAALANVAPAEPAVESA